MIPIAIQAIQENKVQNFFYRLQIYCLLGFILFDFFSISLTHILAFIGGISWLISVHLSNQWNKLRHPLLIPFFLFALASILSVITSLNPPKSFTHLKRLFEMLLFFWALNNLGTGKLSDFLNLKLISKPSKFLKNLTSLPLRDATIYWMIFVATLAAILGIGQTLIQGFDLNHRASGTLSIYMTFAGLLMQVGLVATSYLLFRNIKNKWIWGSLILILVSLLLTLTRQTWLGYLAGLFVLLMGRKPFALLSIPLVLFIVFQVSPSPLKERIKSFTEVNDATLQKRLQMWDLGLKIFKEYPITGCGFRCLEEVRDRYPNHKEIFNNYRTLHSNPIQLAVDAGITGVAAWLFLWISFFYTALRCLKNKISNEDPNYWIIFGSLSSVLGFLVGGFFETNFYDSEVVLLCYFIMALPFSIINKDKVKN